MQKSKKKQKKFVVSMYVVSVVVRIETFAVPRHPIFRSEVNIAPYTATECQSKKKSQKSLSLATKKDSKAGCFSCNPAVLLLSVSQKPRSIP